jgi:hypothetical protein
VIKQRAFPSADKAGDEIRWDRSARWRVLLLRPKSNIGTADRSFKSAAVHSSLAEKARDEK